MFTTDGRPAAAVPVPLNPQSGHPELFHDTVSRQRCEAHGCVDTPAPLWLATEMATETALIVTALAVGVCSGLLAHEWAHAAVLHLTGTEYSVTILPDRERHPIRWLASCPWAVVRPRPTDATPAWSLKVASLAPLALAVPLFALALVGRAPTVEQPLPMAFALGWLACSIPSPQDFSVAFYAHRVIDDEPDCATCGDEPAAAPIPAGD